MLEIEVVDDHVNLSFKAIVGMVHQITKQPLELNPSVYGHT